MLGFLICPTCMYGLENKNETERKKLLPPSGRSLPDHPDRSNQIRRQLIQPCGQLISSLLLDWVPVS